MGSEDCLAIDGLDRRRTQHRLNKVLDFLDKENLIEIEGRQDGEFVSANNQLRENFRPTAFGRKVSQLYIDPLSGVIIRNALESEVDANPLLPLRASDEVVKTTDQPSG